MFNIVKKQIEWGGRTLTLETGRIARQADASVVATYGDTTVLCTVVAEKQAKEGIDFFPLTVVYQEKAFAAGKIPGGYIKREGRPSEKEVLTSRLIDRPIRPLFPDNFYNEVQVICTVLTHDLENDPDIVAMVGASAALTISGMPFIGPIGGARVGYINGQYVLNPTLAENDESVLDLVVAGKDDGVMMVESEAQELSEEQMLGAVSFGHKSYQPIIEMISDMAQEVGNTIWALPEENPQEKEVYSGIKSAVESDLRSAYATTEKQSRREKIDAAQQKAAEQYKDAEGNLTIDSNLFKSMFKKLEKDIVRTDILQTGRRIDGRDTKTIRPIVCEVGVLPRVHGSALFTRGETQALVVTTLGTAQDEQVVDRLEGEIKESFMLHYNFPPYSVGEVGRMSSPGRREIGHGKLAWRAIHPLMPSKEDFPYSVRAVSEITESNGSSSMATVCGTSLALMDAGVPMPNPIAGIAMGLIKESQGYAVLSDILGDEDHLGDMDFKVAGTQTGVTALQMDIKVTGITEEIMDVALRQAHAGRIHILGEMAKALTGARDNVSENAPRMIKIQIPKDKIGELIGPGGANIRDICETTGAKIDIAEDGVVTIAAVSQQSIDAASDRVRMVGMEPELNAIYPGVVEKVMEFGAIVKFMGKRSGLVHISQLAPMRVQNVSDVVKEGQSVFVQVAGFEDRGKIKLSMKTVDQETGQLIQAEPIAKES